MLVIDSYLGLCISFISDLANYYKLNGFNTQIYCLKDIKVGRLTQVPVVIKPRCW